MKSDVYKSIQPKEIPGILEDVERFGEYSKLDHMDTMKLRLLAEEMFSMTDRLLSKYDSEFWVENDKRHFELHLKEWASMDREQRDKLISVSSTQSNARNKGLFGKLSGMMENLIDNGADAPLVDPFYHMGMMQYEGYAEAWSMRAYEQALPAAQRQEDWDGLEKSILLHIADDIVVGVRGDVMEIIVKVKF